MRIIVPTAPDGGNDLVARMLAQSFFERFGVPAIINNAAKALRAHTLRIIPLPPRIERRA